MSTYKNIIVAIDGSKNSERALERTVEIAKRHQSSVHIVSIIDTRSWSNIESHNEHKLEKDSETFASSLMNSYNEAELAGIKNVDIIVESGSPRTIITKDIAKRVNADLIICGASGMTAAERLFLGSVSENIVRTAKCDVLVVR